MRIIRLAAVLMMIVVVRAASAQDKPPQQAPPAPGATPSASKALAQMPTARLQVVLSRFNGEKRVANQPYVLVTVANGTRKVLRTGAEVPIAGVAAGTKDSPSYKSIGTNIVAEVTLYDDGRYLVSVNVESSSPYPDDQKQAGRPAFRNYSLSGMVYLRDGQTAEVATATDSLTGEIIKVEATVTAVK